MARTGSAIRSGCKNPAGLDLISLIQNLSLARGMDEISAIVRTSARKLTGADGISFILRDGDQCHYADEDAISPLWMGQRFPLEMCISGWAMLNRLPVVIEDIYKDPRIPHEAYRLTFVKSLVIVPVRKEDPVAAIGAYWATKRLPTDDEVSLLESIANAAAVALTNLSLYQSLENAAKEAGRQAEEAQQKARELAAAKADLERAVEQKGRFLAACSHDLRQPFQAMRLFHSILADRVGEAERAVVNGLSEALSQGEELLHALLDVSSIESGLDPAQVGTFAINDILDRIRATFADQAQRKGLEFTVLPSKAWVESDSTHLTRILSNLVANAIKYTDAGRILVGVRRRDQEVEIQVADTGIGISESHLGDIFEDFYQVGNAERDRQQGIGLGLGIVDRLAARLGHAVAVRSKVARGSVFSITVPLAKKK